jgi:SAM-dependent methyltransferase
MPAQPLPSSSRRDAGSINEAYCVVLGRSATPLELEDELRSQLNCDQLTLLRGLLFSPEFERIRRAWKEGRRAHHDPDAVERRLEALGPPDVFIPLVYHCLLGRMADTNGLTHYTAGLAGGERRTDIVRALALSGEFERRWKAVPRDTQLCELANPAKWDNDEWLDILRSLGLSDDKLTMHRKSYEFAQLIFGCRRLQALREDSSVLSVGAGHEVVLYWLANHVRRIVATDMYEGAWQGAQSREGDPDVLRDPHRYAPFEYRKEALDFLKMDGRHLAFRDGSFDVAYSLSSIEHFGGLDGASRTIREMGRVLKPGGILALATEYMLAGPRHVETFEPAELNDLIRQPGLELVEPIDDRVFRRYHTEPVNLYGNPYQTPHMLVQFNDSVFTSVMVFLRKGHG